jgi:hypothetical protein
MKPATAANLSLMLVALALACLYVFNAGLLAPDSITDQAEVLRATHMMTLLAGVGLVSAAGALWLSGYGWAEARKRAGITLAACVLPLAFLFYEMAR